MFTDILWRFLILETFVMGTLFSYCIYEHPQKQFCTSEFVLEVKLHKELTMREFWMEILKVFKGNVKELSIWDNKYINLEMAMEYHFIAGKKYIIFGHNEYGFLYSDVCYGNKPSVMVTPFYRRGLRTFYKAGCDCLDEMPTYTEPKYCEWNYSFWVQNGETCILIKTNYFRPCKKGLLISSPAD